MKYLIIFFFFVTLNLELFAQKNTVLVKNTPNTATSSIDIKWFSPSLFHKEGVNLYKRVGTSQRWEKINEKPIIIGQYEIPATAFVSDTTLRSFVDNFGKIDVDRLEGFVKLTALLKVLSSSDFASYMGIQYQDVNVKAGETYQYKVNILEHGRESILGISGNIVSGPYNPQPALQGITTRSGDGKADIIWPQPDDKNYYAFNIYRGEDLSAVNHKVNDLPVLISKTKSEDGSFIFPKVFYTDDSLQNGTTYYYRFEGLDFFGNRSLLSEVSEVTPVDRTPPVAPGNLRSQVDGNTVKLTWNNNSTEVINNFIYRSSDDKEYLPVSGKISAKQTFYEDIVPEVGAYYYKVVAVDANGNEGYSNKILVNIMDGEPPATPANLQATSEPGIVRLSWNANAESDLEGYHVYRTAVSEGEDNYVLLTTPPIKENSFTDHLAKETRNYFKYKIIAVDTSYNRSDYSKEVTIKLPDVTPPEPCFIKGTEVGNEGVLVKWMINLDPDLAGYRIFRGTENNTSSMTQLNTTIINPETTEYLDTHVDPGVKYYYAVNAMDKEGNTSEFSNVYPVSIANTAMEEPPVPFDISTSYKKGRKEVSISWKFEKFEDLMGFVIYRDEKGEAKHPVSGLITDQEFRDSKITPGSTYNYEVRAYNRAGEYTVSPGSSISLSNE